MKNESFKLLEVAVVLVGVILSMFYGWGWSVAMGVVYSLINLIMYRVQIFAGFKKFKTWF